MQSGQEDVQGIGIGICARQQGRIPAHAIRHVEIIPQGIYAATEEEEQRPEQ